jgi:hypothetical protein
MRIGREAGTDEIRDLVGMPVQLDQVGAVDLANLSMRNLRQDYPSRSEIERQQIFSRFQLPTECEQ